MVRDKRWWNLFWDNQNQDFGRPRQKLIKFAKSFIGGHEGFTALDAGTGNGRYAIPLAKLGYVVDAIDFSDKGIERVKAYAKMEMVTVNAEQGDITKLCKQVRQYDLILSSGLLEEVAPSFRVKLLDCFMRWTKPNGINIIKGCLEISGRGKLVEEGLLERVYSKKRWNIIYSYEEKNLRKSLANINFEKKIRTTVIVAQKPSRINV